METNMLKNYLIIDKKILPSYYEKVVEARALLESGKVREVSEAVKQVGISRSTYYKYKDYVLAPSDLAAGRKAVLSMMLAHEKGVLSKMLNQLSAYNANVLTITQSIPIQSKASVTISVDVSDITASMGDILAALETIKGVEKVRLIAIE